METGHSNLLGVPLQFFIRTIFLVWFFKSRDPLSEYYLNNFSSRKYFVWRHQSKTCLHTNSKRKNYSKNSKKDILLKKNYSGTIYYITRKNHFGIFSKTLLNCKLAMFRIALLNDSEPTSVIISEACYWNFLICCIGESYYLSCVILANMISRVSYLALVKGSVCYFVTYFICSKVGSIRTLAHSRNEWGKQTKNM